MSPERGHCFSMHTRLRLYPSCYLIWQPMYGNFGQDSQTFIISKSKQLYLQAMSKQFLKLFIKQTTKSVQHRCKSYFVRIKYNYSMQNIKKHKLGVAIDIDGTLVLKNKILPGAKEALQKLIHLNIPYLLLTNNISRSQQYKAAEINKIFNLSKPLNEKQVILHYTPFKQKFQKFADGIVLVVGREVRLNQVMPLPFIKNYITIDQYASIFPQAVPWLADSSTQKINNLKEQLKRRLKLQSFNKHELKIAGIYVLTVPNNWEKSYQIIIDLLSTNDGSVSTQRFYKYAQNHIPVVVGYNDLSHATHEHNLPRLLMKPFTEGLKAIYKTIYHHDLRIQIYGKPQVSVFQFSKRQLEGQFGPIDKMLMIGDNEGSDIIGAYNSLWDSILVKTGVASLDSQFATINSDNILQGINQYLSLQSA